MADRSDTPLDQLMDLAWEWGCPPVEVHPKRTPRYGDQPELRYLVTLTLPDGDVQRDAPTADSAAFQILHYVRPHTDDRPEQ